MTDETKQEIEAALMSMVDLFNTLSRRMGMHREIFCMSEKHGAMIDNLLMILHRADIFIKLLKVEILNGNHQSICRKKPHVSGLR